MYKQKQLLAQIKEEVGRYEALIHDLEFRKAQLPDGSLIYKRGSYYRAVKFKGKNRQILIPENLSEAQRLIDELKERRYTKKALPVLKRNLKLLQQVIERMELYDAAKIEDSLPSYYKGLNHTAFLLKGDIYPEQWSSIPYDRNLSHPDDLLYQSEGGQLTRSKAEAEIATILEQKGIFFRYEPKLQRGWHCYYPDFCAAHPVHRKQIYWEHFGKMDDPAYVANTMDKLRVYSEHGYRLGDNLIATWETKTAPLTFQHIKERVDVYLS